MVAGRTAPWWVPLWAAALVVFQLGGMLHLAAAPHGVCWEHGVMVEVDAGHAAAGDLALRAPGVARAPVPVVRSENHPHCPALWVTRAARSEATAAAASSLATMDVSGPAPRQRVVALDGWALHRAPKHSPPV